MKDHYYVYVMTDRTHSNFLVDTTTHLAHDVYEAKKRVVDHGVHHNDLHYLVHYEKVEDIDSASQRERVIREQLRHLIYEVINRNNPEWKDLSDEIDSFSEHQ